MHSSYTIRRAAIIALFALLLAGCATQAPYLKFEPTLYKDVRVFNNTQYIPLVKLCDAYAIRWNWNPYIEIATIEKNGRIVLRAGSDQALVNGNWQALQRQAILSGGVFYVPVSFVKSSLGYIVETPPAGRARPVEAVTAPAAGGSFAVRTVVIDPGHGGKDPGAIGRKSRTREKDLTLLIAKRLKGILEEHGIRVIMTREDNTFIPLPKRTEIANLSDADLFVSIHINASKVRAMSGFECYYLSDATDDNARSLEELENSSLRPGNGSYLEHSEGLDKALRDMTFTENRRESAQLAGDICGAVEGGCVTKNRGTRTARFFVLKGTRMPAVLVEVGYISNGTEELRLRQKSFIDKMTDAIAKGILAYKDEYEKTEGFTI